MVKIGLLFPGQGSQYIGMGKNLYEEIPSAKKLMDSANEILDFNIKAIIFYGNEDELKLTEIAQPAIFIVSAMYLEKFKQLEENYEVVAGHSLGEYSALYAAGIINYSDCLKLVRKRGIAMSQKNSLGTMYAVMGVDLGKVLEYIEEYNKKVVVANINSKNQIVISGYIDEITKAAQKLSMIEGAKVKQLNVSSAFHSPLMEDARKIMGNEINSVEFALSKVKIIPNVLGYATDDIEVIKNSLKNQITGQVKWLDTILCMKNSGVDKLYEIGPGDVLTKLNKAITFRPKCYNI